MATQKPAETNTPFEPFVMPSQTGYLTNDRSKVVGTITFAGEILRMPCAKKVQRFEMHRYFGPMPCNKDGDEAERVASDFWDCFERWELGGKLVDSDLCFVPKWCDTCEGDGEESRQLSPRSFESLGPCKKCGGKRLEA